MSLEIRSSDERELALKVYDWVIENLLTEEKTDDLIDIISPIVPWIPQIIVKRVLDKLLPQAGIYVFKELMTRSGWLDRTDRYLDEDNPFRRASRGYRVE